MNAVKNASTNRVGAEGRVEDSRLEAIGWACFLILLGVIWLVPFPSEQILEATFLAGVGLILLGLNLARYLNGIAMRSFSILLGAFALICGLAAFAGLALPFWPVLLILIGGYILLRAVFRI